MVAGVSKVKAKVGGRIEFGSQEARKESGSQEHRKRITQPGRKAEFLFSCFPDSIRCRRNEGRVYANGKATRDCRANASLTKDAASLTCRTTLAGGAPALQFGKRCLRPTIPPATPPTGNEKARGLNAFPPSWFPGWKARPVAGRTVTAEFLPSG